MKKIIRSNIKNFVNKVFEPFGYELAPYYSRVDQYIPFKDVMIGAMNAGISVGDFIEQKYDQPGSSMKTVNKMVELGVFESDVKNICEIGPGSGRYLEKVLRLCSPEIYQIYETADDWRDYLVKEYGVIACSTNGLNLEETKTASVDLVHAHKVFSTIGLYEILHYFSEISRVVRNGGKLVFDVITESCLREDSILEWQKVRRGWPNTLMPKKFVIEYFGTKGFELDNTFLVSQSPLMTECFVFTSRSN